LIFATLIDHKIVLGFIEAAKGAATQIKFAFSSYLKNRHYSHAAFLMDKEHRLVHVVVIHHTDTAEGRVLHLRDLTP